jgi:carboxyl-terminal processing protease
MEYMTTGKPDAYTGPVAILINTGSASASEHFSAAMQDLGRASIVGEPSCGCLLAFMGYANIPGGGELAYSEVGFATPKGRRIEGAGVMPDKLVALTQADLQVARDRALEVAQEILKAETGKNKVVELQ